MEGVLKSGVAQREETKVVQHDAIDSLRRNAFPVRLAHPGQPGQPGRRYQIIRSVLSVRSGPREKK